MRLDVSPFASRQIEAIVGFIAEENPTAAERWYARLRRTLLRIEGFPEVGHQVRELAPLPLKELRHGAYRIIYEVGANVVHVHGVAHGARSLRPRLIGLDDEE